MYIERIELYNFMPYYGTHVIEFPKSSKQNVFIFVGDNMRGKTSILNAIRWCLYSTAYARHQREIKIRDLVNRDSASAGDWTAEVRLLFTHGDHKYQVRRSIRKKSTIKSPADNSDFQLEHSFSQDGDVLNDGDAHDCLARIISKEISRFYFFDGEQLQDYEILLSSKGAELDALKEEIESLLGVPALTQGSYVLAQLLEDSSKQLSKQTKGSEYQKKLRERLRSCSEQYQRINDERLELENDLTQIQSDIQQLQEFVERNDELRQLEVKRSEKKAQIDAKTDLLETRKHEYLNLSSHMWQYLLQTPLQKKLEQVRQNIDSIRKDISKASMSSAHKGLIKQAAGSAECPLCEQPLPHNVRQKLESLSQARRKESDLDSAQEKLVALESNERRLSALFSAGANIGLKDALKNIYKLQLEIHEEKQRLKRYVDSLEGTDTSRINRNYQKLIGKEKLRQQVKHNLMQKSSDIEQTQKEIETIQRQIVAHGDISPSIQVSFELLSGLKSIFKNGLDELRNRLKSEIESNASRCFRSLTTEQDYEALSINENFGLDILDSEGRVIRERSAGAEQIVALSLMDGLSKTANRQAPIVMDTPFGRLDPAHRRNILDYLPSMSEQVILFVHEGELNLKEDLRSFSSRLGGIFRISRISSSRSRVEPEN